MLNASDGGEMSRPGTSAAVAVTHVSRGYRDEDLFERGEIFHAVEGVLAQAGLDAAHHGTADWNPIGDLVRPGGRVVLKPNFVTSRNLHENLAGERLWSVATHPAVLRPLIEYAWKAVGAAGRISIVDCSIAGSHFERTLRTLRVGEMLDALRRDGIAVELIDLRDFRIDPVMLLDDVPFAGRSWNLGAVVQRRLPGDPRGYTVVDLARESYFEQDGLDLSRLRHNFHNAEREPLKHHGPGRHRYSLSNTVLEADLFLNVPKLKTHRKAGVSIALKNVVGTTNKKQWLPHYRAGAPPGGDEYPAPLSWAQWLTASLGWVPLPGGHALIGRWPPLRNGHGDPVVNGNWEGNDTTWRMVLDLNTALRFADRQGRLHATPQRAWWSLVDGVIAGEGQGPLGTRPKACGVILGGGDPVAVDATATRLMGFDPAHVKMIARADPRLGTWTDARTTEAAPRFSFATPEHWSSLCFP
jgi:uncharacterized protein (DUF362 family)